MRCLECRCDFCRSYCDLTDFYNKWPLRIRDEILATTLPGSADVKATPAKRLLSTCNQCGLCLRNLSNGYRYRRAHPGGAEKHAQTEEGAMGIP